MVIETRQKADDLAIAQTLLGGLASAVSSLVRSRGHCFLKILSRSDVVGRVDIYQSVSNPIGGPVFIRTGQVLSVADPDTGEQVIFDEFPVFGEFVRVIYINGGVAQAAFEMSAYLLPVGFRTGAAAGAIIPATTLLAGALISGRTNPSFAGVRQLGMVGNMARKIYHYGPQGILNAAAIGIGNAGWAMNISGFGMAVGFGVIFGERYCDVVNAVPGAGYELYPPVAFAGAQAIRRYQPYMSGWFFTPAGADLVDTRYWFGMFTANPGAFDSLDPNMSHSIGCLYSEGVNGGRYEVHSVGGVGPDTVVDTGIVVVAATWYFHELFHDEGASVWRYYIDGVNVAVIPDAVGPGLDVPHGNHGLYLTNKSGFGSTHLGVAEIYAEQS